MGKMMADHLSLDRAARVPEFDFDAWVKLASEDPEGFEQFRQRAIQAALASFGDLGQGRLRALCGHIDRERAKVSSPMASLLRMLEDMQRNPADIG